MRPMRGRTTGNAFPKLPEPDSARVDDRDLVVFRRIVSDGEILGTVYLRADYELFARIFDYLGSPPSF